MAKAKKFKTRLKHKNFRNRVKTHELQKLNSEKTQVSL
jgi:hypothetical protein